MSKARLLVGTRKGAFVLTSDGKRNKWKISGPHFAGWEICHLKGSPADPNRLYASQTSGWFGQKIQRSNDGGQTWEPVGDKFVYDGVPGTHQWYDGTQHPWEFKRIWHLEPSLTDPDTVFVIPIKSDSEHYPPDGKLRVYRSRTGGSEWEALTKGLPQKDCYVNVLRDASAVDSLEPCGVYFGTTGGQVYGSSDGGDSWTPIVRDFPAVLSVEVQTLP